MSLHDLIANGGKVLVVGGHTKSWEEYRNHPQLIFWSGEQKEIIRCIQNQSFPNNLKAVVMSRFISHAQSTIILHEARKKCAVIFAPLSDGEVARKLKEITTESPKPVVTIQQPKKEMKVMTDLRKPNRGELQEVIKANHNINNTIKQEAQKMLDILKQQGIQTTEISLANAIGTFRRKMGIKGPRSISKPRAKKETKKDEDNQLLKLIDDAMVAMQLVRDEVKKLDRQQTDYLKLKNKLSELLK